MYVFMYTCMYDVQGDYKTCGYGLPGSAQMAKRSSLKWSRCGGFCFGCGKPGLPKLIELNSLVYCILKSVTIIAKKPYYLVQYASYKP